MKFEINETFQYDGKEWTITAIVLDANQKPESFSAVAFNPEGCYYMQIRFEVTEERLSETA